MRKKIAEFVKLVYVMGPIAGAAASVKSSLPSKVFKLAVPYLKEEILVRNNSSDWNVFKQVFVWREYEYPIPFTPTTILDAGANVGYAALWFNRKFPDAQIVSLEPETSNYEMLIKNTRKQKTITAVKGGLWSRSCFLRIIKTDMGNWGFRTEETEAETPDSVQAFGIADIMKKQGWNTIDILKMDIEGAESEVFRHNTETWLPKVKMIFLELHDNINRQCSKAVFSAILKQDFSVDIWGENLVLTNNAFRAQKNAAL